MRFYDFLDSFSILQDIFEDFGDMSVDEITILINENFDLNLTNVETEDFLKKRSDLLKDNTYDDILIYQKMLFI